MMQMDTAMELMRSSRGAERGYFASKRAPYKFARRAPAPPG